MGLPVKLSDELVHLARAEAEADQRSLTAQIEHWARLGRAVEAALRHPDAVALKQSGGDLDRAFPDAPSRRAIYDLLQRIVTGSAGNAGEAAVTDRTVYQSDPAGSRLVMRISAGGKRELGHFKNRRFVPVRSARRRADG